MPPQSCTSSCRSSTSSPSRLTTTRPNETWPTQSFLGWLRHLATNSPHVSDANFGSPSSRAVRCPLFDVSHGKCQETAA